MVNATGMSSARVKHGGENFYLILVTTDEERFLELTYDSGWTLGFWIR